MKSRYKRTNDTPDVKPSALTFAEQLSGKTTKKIKKAKGKVKAMEKASSIKMLNPPDDEE